MAHPTNYHGPQKYLLPVTTWSLIIHTYLIDENAALMTYEYLLHLRLTKDADSVIYLLSDFALLKHTDFAG